MHYFRIPREQWSESLERVRSLGIRAISTYIPWVWHEPLEGSFDFTGATHDRRDLVAFLDLCRDKELLFLARPGPLIYAEFEGLGVPLWLGERYPESVVLRRDGSPDRGEFYFNHSMLHSAYRTRVRRWYEAVVKVLGPYFHDPVITFQLDNETGLLYSNRIGEVDFNPDTVARYQAFLETRYESIERLNQYWKTNYTRFNRILPPRPPLLQPQLDDWQQFVELMICRYLAWLRDVANDLQVPVPFVHNEQGLHHSPAHVCDKTGLYSFLGYDLYPKASPSRATQDFPFATSLYPSLFSCYTDDRHPLWASELGTGWMDPRARVSEESVTQTVFGGLAHGARGVNLFPIHDGIEPTTGNLYRFRTAIDPRGHYTSRARTVEAIARFLQEHGEAIVTAKEVYDDLAFGIFYPNFRLAQEDYLRRSIFLDPHRYLAFLGQSGLHGLLAVNGFNPKFVDVGELGAENTTAPLGGRKVMYWTSKGMVDEKTYAVLEQWVADGGHLITGPVPPTRNMRGYPARYTPLFPVAPMKIKPQDRFRAFGKMISGLLKYWLFHRSRLREEHLSSGHVIDLYEPVLHLLSTPARGLDHEHPWGDPIPGDYLSATFDLESAPPDTEIEPGPLQAVNCPRQYDSSYVVQHGKGSSMVLGTLVAGRYVTPRYYEVAPETRKANRKFLLGLMAEYGIEPSVDHELEVQLVPHKAADGGGYLYVINRLGRQRGKIRLRKPEAWGFHGHVHVVFSLLGSGAVVDTEGVIEVDLFPQDVMVLRFPPR